MSTTVCPEHGDRCSGPDCCCADLHRPMHYMDCGVAGGMPHPASACAATPEGVVDEVAHAFHMSRNPFSSAWAENVDGIQAGIAMSVQVVVEAFHKAELLDKVVEIVTNAEGFDERDEITAAGIRKLLARR